MRHDGITHTLIHTHNTSLASGDIFACTMEAEYFLTRKYTNTHKLTETHT